MGEAHFVWRDEINIKWKVKTSKTSVVPWWARPIQPGAARAKITRSVSSAFARASLVSHHLLICWVCCVWDFNLFFYLCAKPLHRKASFSYIWFHAIIKPAHPLFPEFLCTASYKYLHKLINLLENWEYEVSTPTFRLEKWNNDTSGAICCLKPIIPLKCPIHVWQFPTPGIIFFTGSPQGRDVQAWMCQKITWSSSKAYFFSYLCNALNIQVNKRLLFPTVQECVHYIYSLSWN